MILCLILSFLPRSCVTLCCVKEFRGISFLSFLIGTSFVKKFPRIKPSASFSWGYDCTLFNAWWEAQFGNDKQVTYEYKSHFLQLSHSLNWSFSLLYCKALNSYFFAVRQYGYPVFNAPERLHASINFNPCSHARLIIRLISFCTEVLKYILKRRG